MHSSSPRPKRDSFSKYNSNNIPIGGSSRQPQPFPSGQSPRISNLALPESTGQQSSHLTPPRATRERSTSRPSSRSSFRTHSPSISLDSPAAVRNQMSSLKHSIRQQQAQLNNLESIVRVGPRPYAPDMLDELNDNVTTNSTGSTNGSYANYNYAAASSSATPPPPSAYVSPPPVSTSPTSTAAIKMKRRSSYDVLQNIAGPESSLPLPKRVESSLSLNDMDAGSGTIKEGVPMSFGISPPNGTSPPFSKRIPSPTRTLSRIPIASVGNARFLADGDSSISADTSVSSIIGAPSPSKRTSFTPGNTTKVLADLQTGVINARNALEHTKAQLRLSQRTVSQLTRQTEDLKESRERLRLENEGLNNVVARKERLLQEVLERARKAEAEAMALKQSLKSETSTSKKALREMEAALAESTALSSKSEREYITLRDSIKSMTETWKRDTDRLRDDVIKREQKWKAEAEKIGKDYKQLVQELKRVGKAKVDVQKLKEGNAAKDKELEKMWIDEISQMRVEVQKSNDESSQAVKTAKILEEELARLRRMMRLAGREAAEKEEQESQGKNPAATPNT
ncbi:hypothetical protein FA15DRAFT_676175 [Coprinopsis marcescibilis]|uniref:SWI5-dependent HO expression protein 3 n=1 Tax=Coprinopsis marcescibilis TaxID=230819 RepID=A0A5C3KB29_COPMA|nr:hypothetical protein FA15DRAFT_676175 [Coprinopsis marcescibilis]